MISPNIRVDEMLSRQSTMMESIDHCILDCLLNTSDCLIVIKFMLVIIKTLIIRLLLSNTIMLYCV